MTAELTFSPGFVPGVRTAPRRALRRTSLHAAAPVSPACDVAPPLTVEQRRALAALIHTPAGSAAYTKEGRGNKIAWALVTAGLMAWTLTIAAALLPETRLVSIAVPTVAAHVAEDDARFG